jgi:ABC-type antimicrobial peptide transport system permease subunit
MKTNPPKLAKAILQRFCNLKFLEEVEGDLNEEFQRRLEKQGALKARWHYFLDVLHSIQLYPTKRSGTAPSLSLMSHHLLIIYRNFLRFKSTFLINLLGLSTGLTCLVLIYLWVNDELNFDTFHEKSDRIFQVMEHRATDGSINTSNQTADFLADALAQEMPEIEHAAVVTPPNFFPAFTLSTTNVHVKGVGKFADPSFLNIFSYPLLHGNTEEALRDKNDMIISESLARRLFKTPEDGIGKLLEWELMDIKKQVLITGVFKDVPANASEQFDFILTFDAFRDLMGMKSGETNWDSSAPFFTYVLVKENSNLDLLNRKMGDLLKNKGKNSKDRTLFLKPYADNYLYGQYQNGVVAGGRIEYVRLFSIIAVIIVLIACINFMNLSTAKASKRIKEVGIKKAIGAQRNTLIHQYLGEAFVMTLLSLALALLLAKLLLPQFNEITRKHLVLVFDTRIIIALAVIAITTALFAGAYPALYLSGQSPAKVLKGQFKSSLGELWARKGLVVFQFAASVVFIVSVLVVYKQIEFIQTKNPGYDKDNVICFDIEGKVTGNVQTFISEIKKLNTVLDASSMLGMFGGEPTEGGGTPGQLEWNGKTITMNNAAVNYGLIELLGIELKAGLTFSQNFGSDTDKVIYNEAAIEALGLQDPIGKKIDGKEILGVVKNFHYQSFHETVKPYAFRLAPQETITMAVKIKGGTEKQSVAELQKFYAAFNPGYAFNFKFLDHEYQAQYVAEQRVAVLSKYFAGLAIIISCLGLFGLAAFTTERRRKEISIRKILGLSELGIVFLLSNEFMRSIVLSICLALPISYFITTQWLETFAYRFELNLWYFAGAAIVTLLIAWITVGLQTLKAAKVNPASSLRSE